MHLIHIPNLQCWHIVDDRGAKIEQHARESLARRRFAILNRGEKQMIAVSVEAIQEKMSGTEETPEENATGAQETHHCAEEGMSHTDTPEEQQESPESAQEAQESAGDDLLDERAGDLVRQIRSGMYDHLLVDLLQREEIGAARKTVLNALEERIAGETESAEEAEASNE